MGKMEHHSLVLLVNRSMTDSFDHSAGSRQSLNDLFHTLILMKTNDNM